MSRVFEREMGVEKAFMNSYDGWENVGDAGVIFHGCDFKLLSGLDKYDGCSLYLGYDTGRFEVSEYGNIVKSGNFSLSISRF